MRGNYLALAEKARRRLKRGIPDTGIPEIDEPHRKIVGRIKGGKRKALATRLGARGQLELTLAPFLVNCRKLQLRSKTPKRDWRG